MSDQVVECLQCGESRDAIKASQSKGDPLYCATVDYYGECTEDWERHRFRDYTDKELHFILPEYRHLYRRSYPTWGTPCAHEGKECMEASKNMAKKMGFTEPRCGRCLGEMREENANQDWNY